MADFDKRPCGQDQNGEAGMVINGIYHCNTDLIKALAKALIAKGVITKTDVVNQL